ncbi:DNA-directed RNA polymerase [Podospora australis]|uniref:DNA-directed RNA polymerase n=1 Tax=Podospora australis TaxID=1536484 RepID=A0AAN7AN47_9PEZI|nr:DNA-directed RNA polymerase [Podospora australis]
MADTQSEGNKAKLQIFKDTLYDTVQQHGSETRLFSQRDLLDLDVIPEDAKLGKLGLLLQVVQALCDDKLFIGTNSPTSGLAWKWRSREEAKKYTSLPDEETMLVYGIIDEAGSDGIWNRTIKLKLNMHDSVVKNCIKFLEQKGYIATMKNVEHPNKKMYIKANLRPSDRATGGPWFTEGELDIAFIEELQAVVFEYIKTKSCYRVPDGGSGVTKAPKKGVIKGTAPETNGEAARGVKRSAADISNDDTPALAAATVKEHSSAPRTGPLKPAFLPFPAGYKCYPTVREVAQFVNGSGLAKNISLGEPDIEKIINVLVWDGQIEPIKVNKRRGYRVTRPHKLPATDYATRLQQRQAGIGLDLPVSGIKPGGSGLGSSPCLRCPVLDICEEGGPIGPSNCVYFAEWLGLEDRATPGGPRIRPEQKK